MTAVLRVASSSAQSLTISLSPGSYLLSLLARPLRGSRWVLRFSTVFGVLYVPFLLCFLVDFAKWNVKDTSGLWFALWIVATTKFTNVTDCSSAPLSAATRLHQMSALPKAGKVAVS
jgi:hypothetical protein